MKSDLVARPPLRWFGGKWRLAPWIISHFPCHRTYTEAFGGGGSVLLRKPRCYAEVFNDLDGEVVNFFRVLQSRAGAAELRRRLWLTPFSRGEFNLAYEPTDDPVERARFLAIRSIMGFGTNAHRQDVRTGFRANSDRSSTTPAMDWVSYPAKLAGTIKRLRGVVIENRPAREILDQHDGPEVLHYVDPPYPHSTRGTGHSSDARYAHEMTDDQHRELAAQLQDLKGMVIVSGYPCDLYDQELYPGWMRVERPALADGAAKRTEVLWLNERAAREQSQGQLV